MAKAIQVSDDSGANWYTLPGGSGSKNAEAGQIPDTIFGQTFQSNESGLISWGMQGQAFYKGFAGYKCDIKKPGTSTAFTDEACTLVSGKRYRINDSTKSIWNRTVGITVEDNATPVSASNIESINYLFGEVTFTSSYTPTGAITVTGEYYPTAVLGKAQGYTLTMTAADINTTTFDVAQSNGGYITRDPGLRTVALDVDNVYALASGFAALLSARTEWIIEINPDGNNKSRARGFFKLVTQNQDGDVGALEQESVSFVLNVPDPDSNAEYPFQWQHANDTTLSTAVKKVLEAWQNETKLDVRYLPDGVNGDSGTSVVTECSLSGSLDGMNEFSVSFMGDGALAAVP